jgi:Protein of unknown function (DUF3015)
MSVKSILVLASLLFLIPAFWLDEVAQAATITVQVGDTGHSDCNPSSTGSYVNIAMTCKDSMGNPMVTIAPKSTTGTAPANLARVETAGSDTSSDILRITNARITAEQQLTNYHIIFYRDAPAGPDTANRNVFYKLWLSGTIPTVPAGQSLNASATVEHPIPSTPLVVGQKTVTGVFNTSAPAVQWTQSPMAQTRKLKVDLAITLAPGKVLDLGNHVRLADQALADDDTDCTSWWCIFTTSRTRSHEFVGEPKEARVHSFIDSNWNNLLQEFAQGHGEHLASLASLLEIPPSGYSTFFNMAQQQYAELSRTGKVDRLEMLQLLTRAVNVASTSNSNGS